MLFLNISNFASENNINLHFIGNVDSDEENSDLIDFGILTKCDHLILSHGTFGLWSALLSSKNNNHIIPMDTKNENGAYSIYDESRALLSSSTKNFIYMRE